MPALRFMCKQPSRMRTIMQVLTFRRKRKRESRNKMRVLEEQFYSNRARPYTGLRFTAYSIASFGISKCATALLPMKPMSFGPYLPV